MRKLPAIAVILGVVTLSGCSNQKNDDIAQEYPVIQVTSGPMAVSEKYSASIRGRQDVDILPQIEGKITKIHVTEGQRVNKGQILFTLDQVPYQAALRTAVANVHAAEAHVATARLDVRSKEELFKENVISEYDLSMAKNTLAAAMSTLEQANAAKVNAQNSLSYTEIKSPSEGTVGVLPYKIGALVGPSIQQPLTTVSDISVMYVYFSMTENQLRSKVREYGSLDKAIAEMPEISLILNDGTIYNHTGRIETVSGIINEQTGTLQLRSVFSNPDKLLWSGGIGNVVISHVADNAITIPQTATVEIQDKILVYKLKDGIANASFIKVNPINDGKTYVVTEGLSIGDTIVSEGVGLIQDGQQIKIKQ